MLSLAPSGYYWNSWMAVGDPKNKHPNLSTNPGHGPDHVTGRARQAGVARQNCFQNTVLAGSVLARVKFQTVDTSAFSSRLNRRFFFVVLQSSSAWLLWRKYREFGDVLPTASCFETGTVRVWYHSDWGYIQHPFPFPFPETLCKVNHEIWNTAGPAGGLNLNSNCIPFTMSNLR